MRKERTLSAVSCRNSVGMRPVKQAGQGVSGKRRFSVAMKRALVTLTRQLVVVQVEVHECCQLPKLGWNAAC